MYSAVAGPYLAVCAVSGPGAMFPRFSLSSPEAAVHSVATRHSEDATVTAVLDSANYGHQAGKNHVL